MTDILITTSTNHRIIVSQEDYEFYLVNKWHVSKFGYLVRRIDTKTIIWFSREVAKRMGLDTTKIIDHIDRNRLNNSRDNLRAATKQQNNSNKSKPATNTSGYKGVYFDNKAKKWRSQISIKNQTKYLGIFTDIVDAAKAYDRAAIEIYGDFACPNFSRIIL